MSDYTEPSELYPGTVLATPGGRAAFSLPPSRLLATPVRASRDGSLNVSDLWDTLGIAGVCYLVNYGRGTTFVTAKTALTAAQPDFELDVPGGVAVIPLLLGMSIGAMTGTANHVFVQTAQNLVGAGTSSAATAGPVALGGGGASQCTARQAYTGSGTAPSNPVELYSWDDPIAASGSAHLRFQYQPASLLPIVGPACIVGYGVSTTTALTFKAQLYYAELPAEYVG